MYYKLTRTRKCIANLQGLGNVLQINKDQEMYCKFTRTRKCIANLQGLGNVLQIYKD